MMPRKIVEVVESMLGEAKEVAGLGLLEMVGLDGDSEWKDGTTGLGGLSVGHVGSVSRGPGEGQHNKGLCSTFPSAHSSISSSGRLARGMAVVVHQMGRPSKTTTSQNETMTQVRRRTSDGFSGGGSVGAIGSAGVSVVTLSVDSMMLSAVSCSGDCC